MNIITLDFETFYDSKQGYTLKKLTTEEYVRDHRFQAIGVGVKVNNGETEWGSGSKKGVKRFLDQYDFANSILLCQNTMFDGLILSEHFDIYAKRYIDTMLMAKALHGAEAPASLAALAVQYGVGQKGDEVIRADGMRLEDFSPDELSTYGDYCINDVELTYAIYCSMIRNGFPVKEKSLIDLTLKMFVRPRLELNLPMLEAHLEIIKDKKAKLLSESGHTVEDLMSNPKLADVLREYGVEPPTKISARTGKEAYAFSKTDAEFNALLEHDDLRVQAVVAARLGVKSTLEETRTERFISIAKRGPIPVPLRYYAAHTGRWGGSDKINFQNLPSRGENAGKIKNAIEAPEGYVMIDSDSSQIEARVLAWLACQEDLVEAFREGRDVYKIMASAIYDKPEEEITKEERFMGKTVVLGCGYGLGATKFRASLALQGVNLTQKESEDIISSYREKYPKIVDLWKQAKVMIEELVKAESFQIGRKGVLTVDWQEQGILLPSGLYLRYPNLRKQNVEGGKTEYQYKSRYGWNRIYGGKAVENICQAVARCIIGEQMILIAKRYEVVLTVHDAIACIVKEEEADEAQAYVEQCMRWVPAWAEGLPVNCETGYGRSYGEC
jgi:DNA polymerase I-like protein with 3'-5' exonuclease and polymerase domains